METFCTFTEEDGRDLVGYSWKEGTLKDYFMLYAIREGPQYNDEMTGLAWDPSGHHLYVAFQGTAWTLSHLVFLLHSLIARTYREWFVI
jgi:hypothetical protein